MPAAKKPAKAATKSPAKKAAEKVEAKKAEEPKVEQASSAQDDMKLVSSLATSIHPPTAPEDRVDAPLERLAGSKVVSVKKGVLTVDLAAIANSPQMEREARTSEVRKVLERFQQDPFGVIG